HPTVIWISTQASNGSVKGKKAQAQMARTTLPSPPKTCKTHLQTLFCSFPTAPIRRPLSMRTQEIRTGIRVMEKIIAREGCIACLNCVFPFTMISEFYFQMDGLATLH